MRGWIAVIGVVGVLATACGGHAAPDAGGEQSPVQAAVVAARSIDVPQTVDLFGQVEAERTAAVSSRVMAMVTAVKVKQGDAVRRGQVLVEINADTAQGQVAQARGGLAQAEAGLALAETNYRRFQALFEAHAASQLELDMAKMQYDQAQGAVTQARGAVESASSVARESTVVAPFDGRITAKLVDVGDLAAPGRPLVMVESRTGRRLALAVPESYAGRIKVGDTVEASIDSLPDLGTVTAKVAEMSPGADPAAHTFLIKAELADAVVPSGVSGRARMTVGTRRAVAVPTAAVLHRGGMSMVVVRDADGRARSRAVTVGDEVEPGWTEILSGLVGDEQVLTGIGAVPADGAPVEEVAR